MNSTGRFALLVPVKTLVNAKSRLRGFEDKVRRDLVRAFALDVVTAAMQSPLISGVHVVTDEAGFADAAREAGCNVLPDRGDGDLNAALRAALEEVPPGPVAALLGDLPCLIADDLSQALASASGAGFVADAAGTGTTLLAASDHASFDPRFGPDSRAAHRAGGVPEVSLGVPTLRQDVDTAEDLDLAILLGVGPHTHAVLVAGRAHPRS